MRKITNQALDALRLSMDRHGKIEEVEMVTEELVLSSSKFKDSSKEVRKMFCMRNLKCWLCISLGAVVVILALLFIICDPNFKKCK